MKMQNDLFEYLRQLHIVTTTITHDPVFTVEEGQALQYTLEGGHCKNLFLKDDASNFWLIVALIGTAINLKTVGKRIGAKNLRFASADMLYSHLGVTPGSVTPFGLINDTKHSVRVVLDARLFTYSVVYVHPLVNTASTALDPADLVKFAVSLSYQPIIVDFAGDVILQNTTGLIALNYEKR